MRTCRFTRATQSQVHAPSLVKQHAHVQVQACDTKSSACTLVNVQAPKSGSSRTCDICVCVSLCLRLSQRPTCCLSLRYSQDLCVQAVWPDHPNPNAAPVCSNRSCLAHLTTASKLPAAQQWVGMPLRPSLNRSLRAGICEQPASTSAQPSLPPSTMCC